MIALNHEYLNALPVKSHHLLAKEQAGMEVLPITVVDVSRKKNKVDWFSKGLIDQPLEGAARRSSKSLDWSAFITTQTPEGTIDVQVSGMQEAHDLGTETDSFRKVRFA